MTTPTMTLEESAKSLLEYAEMAYDDNPTMYKLIAEEAALVRSAADELEKLRARVQELEGTLRFIRSVAVDGEIPGAFACLDIAEAAIAALNPPGEKP